jgi:hypothetical protein
MLWIEAIKQVRSDKLTNRDASGLIQFARAVYNKTIKDGGPNIALTPFDWYGYALPALGWSKPGDKFRDDSAHQLAQYPAAVQLWTALLTLAGELDAQGVKFSTPVSPKGTAKTYKQLALDAWNVMKGEQRPENTASAQPVDTPIRVDESTTPSETVPPKKKPASGEGGVALLALLVLAGSKRKHAR